MPRRCDAVRGGLRRGGLTILILALLGALVQPIDAEPQLTYEQREAIWQDFSQWDKAAGISGTVYQEFLGTDASQAFLDDYSGFVFIMQVNKQLVLTGDLEAAWRLVRDRIAESILKELAPGFHSWFGWITAAKAGMELFRDLVFDPMVEQSQLDTYFGLRDAGYEPETAYASVRGVGHLFERAKKEFRKQRGDDPFVPGTNDLRPEIQPQFLRFVKAGIETKYQEKLHREFVAKFQEAAREAEARLPALREELLTHLRRNRIERIEIDPASSEVRPGEQVTLTAIAIYADPTASQSARDVTGAATWSGVADDNIFLAKEEHVGRSLVITAEYARLHGTATITVAAEDCGSERHWDPTSNRCVCNDPALEWNEDLAECIPPDEDAGAAEILADVERDFYEAIRLFEEHHGDFRARLQALGGQPADIICSDGTLAFCLARAAAAYELVDAYLGVARALVDERDPDVPLHIKDETRLYIFPEDHARVQERAEAMPELLIQYAPGCDIEEMLDTGARIAEGDQDAESGVDIAGTTGDIGGGGIGGGGLRYVPQGSATRDEDTYAQCVGGTLSLDVGTVDLPTEIRADETIYTITVGLSWVASGTDLDDVGVAASVWFLNAHSISEEIESWSGSRTLSFTFNRGDIDFSLPGGAVIVNVSAAIICDGGSSDAAAVQVSQFYVLQGSE